jgi:hypothetical protein
MRNEKLEDYPIVSKFYTTFRNSPYIDENPKAKIDVVIGERKRSSQKEILIWDPSFILHTGDKSPFKDNRIDEQFRLPQ